MLVDTQPPTAAPPMTDATADLDLSALSWDPSNDFRHGISHLARGVAVLTTTDDEGERYGVTTTGICVLSVEPPALVACVRRRSKLGIHLPRTRRFCVNVLSEAQQEVAEAFAGRRGTPVDRFNHGRWSSGSTGAPVLADATASFECEVDLLYGYPDHTIVVGNVRAVAVPAQPLDPLIYTSGRLAGIPIAPPQ